jgi:hypothetical protein
MYLPEISLKISYSTYRTITAELAELEFETDGLKAQKRAFARLFNDWTKRNDDR